jgi:cysteine desulfurase
MTSAKPSVYLDHGASTAVRPEAIEAMLPYMTALYGNPSSVHQLGRQASRGLEGARRTFADLLGAAPDEIIFTGSGSESDNLAIRGAMFAAHQSGRGNHLITSAVEHKAVLATAQHLRDDHGFDLTVLAVDSYGRVDLEALQQAIRPDTVLISVMSANNEIGTLNPIESIGRLARERGILFHTDAVQAVAVAGWDLASLPVDLLSLAPHKFYGPKGFGVLFARRDVPLTPIVSGGSQEDGRRAGTENVPYAVGAAEAFRLAVAERDQNVAHYETLRDALIAGILAAFPGECLLTGHPTERLPHNASFAFRELSGNDLLIHLDVEGIFASSGSACLTGDPKPSAVLEAIGLSEEWTRGGLRLTVGRQNTLGDVHYTLEVLPKVVERMRSFKLQFA